MGKDTVLDRLEAADWKDISLRLAHFAVWRASLYKWNSGDTGLLPRGKTPEDVACEAIEKVWNGTRNWDPEIYPDLLKHLMKIVESDISHLFKSADHRKRARAALSRKTPEGEEDPDPDQSFLENAAIDLSTPEALLVSDEEEQLRERIRNDFYSLVEGDDDLESVLLCFEEGIFKPEAIAVETGLDKKKVYNLKKKLLRRAAKFGNKVRPILRKEA